MGREDFDCVDCVGSVNYVGDGYHVIARKFAPSDGCLPMCGDPVDRAFAAVAAIEDFVTKPAVGIEALKPDENELLVNVVWRSHQSTERNAQLSLLHLSEFCERGPCRLITSPGIENSHYGVGADLHRDIPCSPMSVPYQFGVCSASQKCDAHCRLLSLDSKVQGCTPFCSPGVDASPSVQEH